MPPPIPRPYPRNPYGDQEPLHYVSCKISEQDYVYLKSLFPTTTGLCDATLSNLLHKYICDLRTAGFSSNYPIFSSDHPLAPLIPALLGGAARESHATQATTFDGGGRVTGFREKNAEPAPSSLPPSPKKESTKGKETKDIQITEVDPIIQPIQSPGGSKQDADAVRNILAALGDKGIDLGMFGVSD